MTTGLIDRIHEASQDFARATGEAMESLEPGSNPAWAKVGTGSAVFCGDRSPLSQVAWIGYKSEFDDRDFEVVEGFYRGRADSWEYVLTPYSDTSLVGKVIQRGWSDVQYENVMGRQLSQGSELDSKDVDVQIVTESNADAWAHVSMSGFFGDTVPPEFANLSQIIARTEGTIRFLAYLDGVPAGAASLLSNGETCYLGGAATLEEFRGRGAQAALLNVRLRHAVESGCNLAVCECLPGSQSQRNQERAGFQVLYTKMVMTRPYRD